MAKAPIIGQVKTRLGKEIGQFAACQFYKRTLKNTIFRLKSKKWQTVIAITPDKYISPKKMWQNNNNLIPQGLGNLGERMQNAMEIMPPGPVVIVGTDIPKIELSHIEKAFSVLGYYDAVFGPSFDGGFWLVGLKRRPKNTQIFKKVRWSSTQALTDTLSHLPKKASVLYLEKLIDVDTIDDYRNTAPHQL